MDQIVHTRPSGDGIYKRVDDLLAAQKTVAEIVAQLQSDGLTIEESWLGIGIKIGNTTFYHHAL